MARIVEQKSEGLSLSQVRREAMRSGIRISRGGIQQIIHRSAEVLAPLNDQVREHIRAATHVWMDETPHRIGRSKGWIWMARTRSVVWFFHSESRGKHVVQAMLGQAF
ncbi:MAG: transposase, partial [Deltaproteobacteria bacterium]|nr:transposase [Deltaproteobacteria bacterium]